MKESGVVCKKKKVYLLSLLLFLISYLITVVNMVVNIITGGFHLHTIIFQFIRQTAFSTSISISLFSFD